MNGDAVYPTKPATRCPTPRAAASARRPISVATGSESRRGASGGASCRVLTPPSSERWRAEAARCGLRTCYGSGQRSAQPVLFDAPVPVLGAVDQDHRDAVAVLRAPLRVGVD